MLIYPCEIVSDLTCYTHTHTHTYACIHHLPLSFSLSLTFHARTHTVAEFHRRPRLQARLRSQDLGGGELVRRQIQLSDAAMRQRLLAAILLHHRYATYYFRFLDCEWFCRCVFYIGKVLLLFVILSSVHTFPPLLNGQV